MAKCTNSASIFTLNLVVVVGAVVGAVVTMVMLWLVTVVTMVMVVWW